MKMRICTTYNF